VALDLIAVHRLIVAQGNPASVGPIGAAAAAQLSADAIEQIEGYVADLAGRDELEGSRATAGWFDPAEPNELAALRDAASVADFEQASGAAMSRLAGRARGNATSGVVLFVRQTDGPLACLKLDPGPLTRTRVPPGADAAATALAVEKLEDVLPEPRDLKKGALIPSPSGADVRVVDLTKVGDPAGYWVDFLGAVSIRAAATASDLVVATIEALERDHVEPPRARALVATRWERTAAAPAPVPPEQFVRDVAADAQIDPQRAWDYAKGAKTGLANPHAVVAPVIARRLRRIVDVGDGVRITGPAAQVDRRVEEDQDAHGWFVTVRATRRPEYGTG
jgi:hypothetical protein